MNPVPGMLLFLVVVVVAVVVLRRHGRGDEERKLRALAGEDAAERLIRFEQARSPAMSRPEAARRARERLLADRMR